VSSSKTIVSALSVFTKSSKFWSYFVILAGTRVGGGGVVAGVAGVASIVVAVLPAVIKVSDSLTVGNKDTSSIRKCKDRPL